MKKRFKVIVNALAAWQIFGGFLGIGLAIRIMPGLKGLSGTGSGMVFLAAVFYLFSVACGIILFKNRKSGLNLSLLNQVLQVLNFAIGSYAYNYVAGFKIGFGIDFMSGWLLKLNLSVSSFRLILNSPTGSFFMGLNLLALVLVYVIERLKEVQAKNEDYPAA